MRFPAVRVEPRSTSALTKEYSKDDADCVQSADVLVERASTTVVRPGVSIYRGIDRPGRVCVGSHSVAPCGSCGVLVCGDCKHVFVANPAFWISLIFSYHHHNHIP